MNIIKKYLIFFFALFATRNCVAQKDDSLNKKEPKYSFGITIAPNYSWRKYQEAKHRGNDLYTFGVPENERPAMGYSILITEQITLRRFMFNIGLGTAFFNYKGYQHYGVPYKYKHAFISIPMGCNVLLGKNKLWYSGLTIDINYLLKLTQEFKSETTGNLIGKYDFTKRMFVILGGFEFGRTIKAAKWLTINVSISAKYSSKININYIPKYPDAIITQPRNLMTSSVNISFYPIFKQK